MFDPLRQPPDLVADLNELIAQIPPGRVATCGDLADALGNPVASRWIGHYLLHHEHGPRCFCHRIVRAGGTLGGYVASDESAKAAQLAREGVAVLDGRVDLSGCRFYNFRSDRPLAALTEWQQRLRRRVSLAGLRRMPALVGGVDVSYVGPEKAVAAYALVDRLSRELVWSTTIRRTVTFPYISSYLTFRELPVLLNLLDEVRAAGQLAEIVLVDGTGILHPRRSGIATALGVVGGLRTVGVTKKLLCGRVESAGLRPGESCPVRDGDEVIGAAILTSPRGRKPIYVSPGNKMSVAMATRLVWDLMSGHKLPEPLYWADHLSRKRARRVRQTIERRTACRP